jgi:hypothetical protein
MLSLGSEKRLEGSNDSVPIVLADVHLADGDYPEITVEEFELALSVMYPESVCLELSGCTSGRVLTFT